MPLAKALSISLFGLQGRLIEVEADISATLPGFQLVGLPDASLQEASARVRAAIVNTGLAWPNRKITVNLSPASVPKSGSSFDLAIAAAILAANGALEGDGLSDRVLLGELTLDGAVRGIRGILPAVQAAKTLGVTRFVVPASNLAEARLVGGVEITAVSSLADFAAQLGVESELRTPAVPVESIEQAPIEPTRDQMCMSEVLGQDSLIRAAAIAAVGGHHMMLVGPPGAGKTMVAERLPGILPRASVEAAIELAAVRSLLGLATRASDEPPFVAPHHSISSTGLIGGGTTVPRPGLISQAHGGVLFLDEAPEFSPHSLDSLREPLESGEIAIARSGGVARFPARFQLVMAANPCPCGHRGVSGKDCTCNSATQRRYESRLSGPLLDRIDIRLRVQPATKAAKQQSERQAARPTSERLRKQVSEARTRTRSRLAGTPWKLNSEVSGAYLRRLNRENPKAVQVLELALTRGTISMRGFDRCLRIAWSIADLEGLERLTASVVGEAMFLRGSENWAVA